MATQTQLLQCLTEAVVHQNVKETMEEDLLCKIERFMLLKLPTFSYSKDPLDADERLKVIETKLDVTSCIDNECVALAVH